MTKIGENLHSFSRFSRYLRFVSMFIERKKNKKTFIFEFALAQKFGIG